MFAKIIIKGEIELVTGMHIGTGGEFAAIGAVDSPVVRDMITQLPIIPGSTFKGKLRSVLAKKYSKPNANGAGDDCLEIKRLFGSQDNPSRVIFFDMSICNMDELSSVYSIYTPTEVKFENTINRLSSIANPRQIERTIRGCKFDMQMIYELRNQNETDSEILKEGREDIEMLAEGMKLLEYDYLGGHGTRGYGKIKFNNLSAELVAGDVEDSFVEAANTVLKEVN